jgi:hypothetical protein
MQKLGLPLSPGKVVFVTNEDEGVGKVGDGPVEAQDDVDAPEEYVKDSQPEMLLSPAVHDFERPRFGLTAARPFGTKSRSSMAASRLSIVGAFPIFDSNPANGEEEFFNFSRPKVANQERARNN